MDYSELKGISVAVQDGLATVTLLYQGNDAVAARHQHDEIGRIWRLLDADTNVKAVLITGVGDKEFYLSGKPTPGVPPDWKHASFMEREVQAAIYEMMHFGKPVVAAVNGAASGAGLTVVLLADVSVMAEDAWLFDPHVMLGISAGDGAGSLLPLFIGIAKAKLYLLTSDALDAREAERLGLIGRVVPRERLMEVASDYARRFAAGPEVALRFSKRGINQWLRLAGLVSQDYSFALETLSYFSGERGSAPHTDWPPRRVP